MQSLPRHLMTSVWCRLCADAIDLSGRVFYSLSLLPPFWQAVSKLNPIVYMISGFRYGFLGITDVSLAYTIGVLVVFIAVFYAWAWYLIERGTGLRT